MFDENLDYPQFFIAPVGLLSARITDLQAGLVPPSQRLGKTIIFPTRIKVFYRSLRSGEVSLPDSNFVPHGLCITGGSDERFALFFMHFAFFNGIAPGVESKYLNAESWYRQPNFERDALGAYW